MHQQYQIDIARASKHINQNVYQIDIAALNARMKSIDEIRRENMRTLVSNHCNGTLKEFAAAVGIQPGQASHLNTGFRNIGDNIARRIENAFTLEKGWMDRDHNDTQPESEAPEQQHTAAESAAQYNALPPEIAPLVLAAKDAYLRGSLKINTIDNLVQIINSLGIEPPSTEQMKTGSKTIKSTAKSLRDAHKPR
ncbi:hypothetical protein [Vogesella oryzae]|uniref:hypothetical protein n=1 Tax=Vogesella oryzae TaxID=1735285 RepID=UPI001581AFA1|nr:hypothetical protein [Vogesella oryzae]